MSSPLGHPNNIADANSKYASSRGSCKNVRSHSSAGGIAQRPFAIIMPTTASAWARLQLRTFLRRNMLARMGRSPDSYSISTTNTPRRARQGHYKANSEASNTGASMNGCTGSVNTSLSTKPSGTGYEVPVAEIAVGYRLLKICRQQ